MGWASGSELLERLITVVEDTVDDRLARVEIYKQMIDAFEDHDCDTVYECVSDPTNAFAEAFYTLHPDWSDED